MRADRPAGLARARQADAGALARQERRRALRLPARHPRRRGKPIGGGRLWVFTTRADTIMGVTFCAVAPEHPLALRAAESNPAVAAFLESCKTGGTTEAELATQAKRGIDTGLFVEHPLSHEQIPLWVGNYVLIHYGDGAVMGVPAHDERDFAFARQYGIDMLQVVHVDGEEFSYDDWQDWYADTTCSVTVNSDNYSGLAYEAAVDAVAAALEHRGLGGKQTTWRLRDWGISRQRYWGTPIPIVHCEVCGVVPVPEKDLPVVLPEDLIPDGSGNPLARHGAFLNVACPEVRPAGAPRNRHDGHLRRQRVVLHALLRSAPRRRDGRRRHRLLDADGPVHRRHRARHPAPALRALLDQGDARHEAGRDRRAVHQAAHAGHGAEPRLGPYVRAGRRRLLPARPGHADHREERPQRGRPLPLGGRGAKRGGSSIQRREANVPAALRTARSSPTAAC